MKQIKINEIEGFRIGNAQDTAGATGCTVIISDEGAVTGLSVEGGGPAGRESLLLDPKMAAQAVHCVMLSGGSAFGLDAAGGAMKYLEERNIGFDVGMGVVPLVPASCLFDLITGDFNARPDADMGYAACVDSESSALKECPSGNVGAGTGATVGKFMGLERLMKSGLGTYAVQQGELKIGAIAAVNALGDVFDVDTGEKIAGLMNESMDGFADTSRLMWESVEQQKNVFGGNTTLGCIICNADLTKDQCHKLASMAQDGYARTIRPVHTTADGDSIYFMARGSVTVNQDALGDLAAYVMAKAINDAVRSAQTAYGCVSAGDISK